MNNVLISVVVPVYNTPWSMLKECVDSIKAQSVEDYEVIIIDDCSSDASSIKECKEYLKGDSRFVFLQNEKNSGVSYTRNIGIDNSTGDYILFVDADDWIERDMFAELADCARRNSVDTVFYECFKCKEEKKVPVYRNVSDGLVEHLSQEMLKRMILTVDFNTPWLTLYSNKIIKENNVRFKSGIAMGEDFLFNVHYYENYSKGIYLKKCLYNYRFNSESATNKFKVDYVRDCGNGYYCRKYLLEKYFKNSEMYVEIESGLHNMYVKATMTYLLNGIMNKESKEVILSCIEFEWIQELLKHKVKGLKFKIIKFIIKGKHYVALRALAMLKEAIRG